MDMLRSRNEVPKVIVNKPNGNSNSKSDERLVILPDEESDAHTAVGRPIGPQYHDKQSKLNFMNKHGIGASIVSLANPWLDFLKNDESVSFSRLLNEDLQEMCDDSIEDWSSKNDNIGKNDKNIKNEGKELRMQRLYGFGVLPNGNGGVDAMCREVEYIGNNLSHIKGIIMGTHGIGNGLNDKDLLPLYKEICNNNLCIFIHPHYGIGNEYYTGFGHALYLALGFTFETTVSVSRLILSGILDECKDLKLLLSHCGGTLPYLA